MSGGDSRDALIQALNAYTGAAVIVSHDRHMIEMIADRPVLVDAGTAREFDGSLDDYIAFILGKDGADAKGAKSQPKPVPISRDEQKRLRKVARDAEAELTPLTERRDAINAAMADPAKARGDLPRMTMGELAKARAELERKIADAEGAWLEAIDAMERLAA